MYEEQLFATAPSRRRRSQGPSLAGRSRAKLVAHRSPLGRPLAPSPAAGPAGLQSAQSRLIACRRASPRSGGLHASLARLAPWRAEAWPSAALSLGPSGRTAGRACGGPGAARAPSPLCAQHAPRERRGPLGHLPEPRGAAGRWTDGSPRGDTGAPEKALSGTPPTRPLPSSPSLSLASGPVCLFFQPRVLHSGTRTASEVVSLPRPWPRAGGGQRGQQAAGSSAQREAALGSSWSERGKGQTGGVAPWYAVLPPLAQ